jgi:hypothetical protein
LLQTSDVKSKMPQVTGGSKHFAQVGNPHVTTGVVIQAPVSDIQFTSLQTFKQMFTGLEVDCLRKVEECRSEGSADFSILQGFNAQFTDTSVLRHV